MSTEDMIQIDSSRFLAATRNASYIYNKATDISEEFRLDKDSPLIFYSSCKDGDNEDETRLRTDEGDGSFSGGHRRADRIPDSGILHQGVQEPLRRNTGALCVPGTPTVNGVSHVQNVTIRIAKARRNRSSDKDARKMMGIPEISSYFYMLVGKTENILTELKGNNTNN